MVVYLDVLIFLNTVIDFCLLNLTSFIVGRNKGTIRIVFASLFAASFSLMIFVPNIPKILEIAVMLISAFLTILLAFGRCAKKLFIKLFLSFIAVSVAFNGIVTIIWFVFKPDGMILRNSVFYFNVSAIEMIFWTIISYIIIKIILLIIRRSSPLASRCRITLFHNDKTFELVALIDTGNSLKDIYTGKQVIIVDFMTAEVIFGVVSSLAPILLPYSTVDGEGMISAYKCNRIKVNNSEIGTALIAVTDKIINDSDYRAIVNPQILNEGESNEKII